MRGFFQYMSSGRAFRDGAHRVDYWNAVLASIAVTLGAIAGEFILRNAGTPARLVALIIGGAIAGLGYFAVAYQARKKE